MSCWGERGERRNNTKNKNGENETVATIDGIQYRLMYDPQHKAVLSEYKKD